MDVDLAMDDGEGECCTGPPPDAIRMAPYSLRAPSPPVLHVPVVQFRPDEPSEMRFTPSAERVDPTQLTDEDLFIITGGKTHVAVDRVFSWRYEDRRRAQHILDFLVLGPTSVVRDDEFLRREAVTMMLVARDARMGDTRLVSVDVAASRHGIVRLFVDVEYPSGVINAWSHAVRLINDHLVSYHRARGRRGKVLVMCESGNDRSAAIVVAYLMALFGVGVVPAIQFTSVQRFCCCFEEDVKRLLVAWGDILRARRAVAGQTFPRDAWQQQQQQQQLLSPQMQGQDGSWPAPSPLPPTEVAVLPEAKAKRGLDDGMEDGERFVGRGYSAPFGDVC